MGSLLSKLMQLHEEREFLFPAQFWEPGGGRCLDQIL